MLPIIGLLVSGVVAVIAIPELNRGMAPEDRFDGYTELTFDQAAFVRRNILFAI